jgi:hypothetical protein
MNRAGRKIRPVPLGVTIAIAIVGEFFIVGFLALVAYKCGAQLALALLTVIIASSVLVVVATKES